MARFELHLTTPLPPDEAWRRVWDLDAHTRVIPLTRLHGDGTGGAPLGTGSRFTARTALGPLGVDDVMELTDFRAPTAGGDGHARLTKHGRAVRGHIDARVTPAPGGSTLTWRQDISLLGVPRALDPALAVVARTAYGRVLRTLLAGA